MNGVSADVIFLSKTFLDCRVAPKKNSQMIVVRLLDTKLIVQESASALPMAENNLPQRMLPRNSQSKDTGGCQLVKILPERELSRTARLRSSE